MGRKLNILTSAAPFCCISLLLSLDVRKENSENCTQYEYLIEQTSCKEGFCIPQTGRTLEAC